MSLKFYIDADQLIQQQGNLNGAINSIINESEIVSGIWSSLPKPAVDGIIFLFNLAKIAGILFIVYLVFLLIKTLYTMKQAARLKSIEQNVKEINEKITLLTHKERKHAEPKKEK